MATMHETLIGLAEMSRVLAHADFIRHHEAASALGHQKPGMVEAWSRAGSVAVPAETGVRHVLVDLALDRQSKSGPAPGRTVSQHLGIAEKSDIFGVRVPQRPPFDVDDLAPDLLARCLDDELVVRKQ